MNKLLRHISSHNQARALPAKILAAPAYVRNKKQFPLKYAAILKETTKKG
jgi:hypothetical protein